MLKLYHSFSRCQALGCYDRVSLSQGVRLASLFSRRGSPKRMAPCPVMASIETASATCPFCPMSWSRATRDIDESPCLPYTVGGPRAARERSVGGQHSRFLRSSETRSLHTGPLSVRRVGPVWVPRRGIWAACSSCSRGSQTRHCGLLCWAQTIDTRSAHA